MLRSTTLPNPPQASSLWARTARLHRPLAKVIALASFAALTTGCGLNDVRKPTTAPTATAPTATPASATPQAAGNVATGQAATATAALPGLWDLEVERIDGSKTKLDAYRGKAVLIVNTASECGYTPQYAGLQELYARYQARGFEVLAFPSNDFGGQEPGEAKEIQSFCSSKFQITFPLFAKVHAKGDDIAPLYRMLTEKTPAGVSGPIKWNFTKFLITPAGGVAARFEPGVEPMDPRLTSEVEKVLPKAEPTKVEI